MFERAEAGRLHEGHARQLEDDALAGSEMRLDRVAEAPTGHDVDLAGDVGHDVRAVVVHGHHKADGIDRRPIGEPNSAHGVPRFA